MYNKISSIILNSGKANGFSDVFVAQPDSLKESLAGKIFIIAEIGGKKTDGRKIFDFLISSLNDTYYNDEKILLRDKIEGLKIENIFEAAISKTNKNLVELLATEKIKLNTAATNITIGVIYENKLYFSGFGKNRALLIYRHGEQYEVINVEANAAEVSQPVMESGDKASFKTPSIFSSVISGEIPTGSYFVFTSEALPEYVSGKDMISIITKLPPIVAAEQIKNILAKINSFIPFLGVIIKNTVGTDNQEMRDEVEENLTAHSSISSLNYTEQKTERMLEPAGLISLSKIYKGAQRIVKNMQPKQTALPKKVYRSDDDKPVKVLSIPAIDLGKVKSLNIARADSFLLREKISFKKKPSEFGSKLKQIILNLPQIFNFKSSSSFYSRTGSWFSGLNKKNRLLFVVLAAVVIVFFVSIGTTNFVRKQQAATNNYNNLVATIEEKQSQIDNYLSYGNEDGAKSLLIEAQTLLSYLPKDKKDQLAVYSRLENNLNTRADKLQKVVRVASADKTNDLSGLQVTNIVFASGKLYAASAKIIYGIIPQSSSSDHFAVAGASNLIKPQFDSKGVIYYWDNNRIIKFDLKTTQSSAINVSAELSAEAVNGYKIFNNKLYILASDKNQIYSSVADKNGYSVKTDWLKETADLSKASDLAINGNIFVLKADGSVSDFRSSKSVSYSAGAISPVMTSANKIIVGTKYVYIFEASSKRLVVLALADGHLMNQYQVGSLAQPKDFAIDEANKTAYFLDSDMVYRITLNQ
jgi:CRISPR/Cas system-associated protein endoribonuclease Cas2